MTGLCLTRSGPRRGTAAGLVLLLALSLAALSFRCSLLGDNRTVPREGRFGIYALDLASGDIRLVRATDDRLVILALDPAGSHFAFSRCFGGDDWEHEEVCVVDADGEGFRRLTDNDYLDTYPVWSPSGSHILHLSWPDSTLSIYTMTRTGDSVRLLYDSGFHDSDPSWVGGQVAFTSRHRVWLMNDDGTGARPVSDPPRAGERGNAVLPFGDYDPRLSPDGRRIVFSRLVNDLTVHGNYDLFLINPDGTGETRLTTTGWTQGVANWSPDGRRLVFLVSAVGTEGSYDIWLMNADGTNPRNVTPAYVPADFLCHSPLFAPDGETIYFIGQWWE